MGNAISNDEQNIGKMFDSNEVPVNNIVVENVKENKENKNVKRFRPRFTFLNEEDFDILVTKYIHNNEDYFLKEFFSHKTGELLITEYHNKWYKTETMPGIYDESISDSILTISNKGIIFSGEKYLNGQLFIEDYRDPNSNVSTVIEHIIYKPDGEVYIKCSSSDLSSNIKEFIDEYYSEIIDKTQ